MTPSRDLAYRKVFCDLYGSESFLEDTYISLIVLNVVQLHGSAVGLSKSLQCMRATHGQETFDGCRCVCREVVSSLRRHQANADIVYHAAWGDAKSGQPSGAATIICRERVRPCGVVHPPTRRQQIDFEAAYANKHRDDPLLCLPGGGGTAAGTVSGVADAIVHCLRKNRRHVKVARTGRPRPRSHSPTATQRATSYS